MSEEKVVTLKEVRLQKVKDTGKEMLTLWFTDNQMLCIPNVIGRSIDDFRLMFNSGIDRLEANSRIKA